MKKTKSSFAAACIASCVASTLTFTSIAEACTRFVYLGNNNLNMTARSMDWAEEIGTNLWIMPRGIQRSGEAGPNSVKWTAKYGSVIASAYDISTADGMNEAGLVANVLWLAESEYPKYDGKKPGLSISTWAQYLLDQFATVDEAVKHLESEPFTLVTDEVPGQNRKATLHLSISDASGDSAIIEYINGKQVIHHSREFQVMTNSPTFQKQLALNAYWKEIGGTVMLPGTNRAADRFARAAFYVNAIPKSEDLFEATASVFSVIRNVSVPYGIATPGQPNIASTRWRTVADQKNLTYYFDSALTPNVFWVNLKKIDFSKETGTVQRLGLGPDQRNTFSGETNDKFVKTKPFKFLGH